MIGAKLKIALLYDVWNEDPVAAAAKEEAEPGRKPQKKVKKAKKAKTDARRFLKRCRNWGTSPPISSSMGARSRCTRSRAAMPTSFST